jgi:hypothetical protein
LSPDAAELAHSVVLRVWGLVLALPRCGRSEEEVMLRKLFGYRHLAAVALCIGTGCMAMEGDVQDAPALATYEAAAPEPSVRGYLRGRSARTVLHEELNEAENLFFTDDGRLLVSGGEDIYEIKRSASGTFTKTDYFHEDCLVEGIVHSGGFLYGVCTHVSDSRLPAYLIAGELNDQPVLRTIAALDAASVPNGMTVDPEGHIYITCWVTNRIIRLTLGSPLEVSSVEVWASDISLANGLKYVDHALYVTTLEPDLSSRFLRIPVLADGSAGAPEKLYDQPLTVFDDIIAFEGGFIISDFLKGTLIFWSEPLGVYAETWTDTFYGPTSLAQGQPPMFNTRQLIVAEKGALGVRDEVAGDLLSMYELP